MSKNSDKQTQTRPAQLGDIPHILDNSGNTVFLFNHEIGTAPRPVPAPEFSVQHKDDAQTETAEEETEENSIDNAGKPADDDGLIRRRWRLLSAVRAWPQNFWGLRLLVDYGVHDNGKALREAVKFVNRDEPDFMKGHSWDTDDIIGKVNNGSWENSQDIPPGINADVVVDPQYAPKEAYAVEHNIYRSGSLGVNSQTVKSHPKMEDREFIEKQGQKVDGEIVCLKVSKFDGIRHMAAIPFGTGADKNAGLRNSETEDPAPIQTQPAPGGKKPMEKWLMDLTNGVFDDLRIERPADLFDLKEPPEGFETLVGKRREVIQKALLQNAALKAGLQPLDGFLKNEGEVGLEVEEIVKRLPAKLEMAAHGSAFLEHQRKEALTCFDAVEKDPGKKDFTDLQQRRRTRIETSQDLAFVEDELAHYKAAKEQKFELNRSSESEELPGESGGKKPPRRSGSANRIMGGGEKK